MPQLACFERGLTPEDHSWASEDLTAVAILDSRVALVVSRAGSIYRTEDAGDTFRRVYADPTCALADLSMFGAESGWAVGDGRILSTTDGGRSWRVQPLPEAYTRARLRGVHAIDTDHVLVVGLAGVRLRTQNGGRLWEDRSEFVRIDSSGASASSQSTHAPVPQALPPEVSFDADLHDVVCAGRDGDQCVSLGGTGGVAYSTDRGANWTVSRRLPRLPFEAIEMPSGSVELSREAIDRIIDLVERSSGRSDTSLRVEAVAGGVEIDGLARGRHPEMLFEILDARAADAVGVLESAGIDAGRIEVRGAPPWGYQDLSDDAPEYLARYWQGRRAPAPGVRIYVVDERPMHSGRFLAARAGDGGSDSEQVLAVGAAGAIWRSLDRGESWQAAIDVGDADLFALGQDLSTLFVGGDQGILRESLDRGVHWESRAWPKTTLVTDRMQDLEFASDSGFGIVVGGGGLILKRGARGEDWKRIVAPNP